MRPQPLHRKGCGPGLMAGLLATVFAMTTIHAEMRPTEAHARLVHDREARLARPTAHLERRRRQLVLTEKRFFLRSEGCERSLGVHVENTSATVRSCLPVVLRTARNKNTYAGKEGRMLEGCRAGAAPP